MQHARETNRRLAAAILAGLILPAVAGAQQVTPIRRDSAGIALVSYARDAAPRRFALQAMGPGIGTAPGAEFHRIITALRLPNGRVVVADAGRREILRFSPAGALERPLARTGAGPGEFTNLRSMHRHSRDSLVAHDGSQMRYAVFSDSGFVRQVLLMKSEFLYQIETSLLGLRAAGNAIVTSGAAIPLSDPGPARIERTEFPLVEYGSDGQASRLLGRYPGHEFEIAVLESGRRAGGFHRRLRPFGATSVFALSGDQVIVVDNSVFGFDVVDGGGRLIRRVRRQWTPEAVRASHMTAYADERVSAVTDPDRKAKLRAEYLAESHASHFPALEPRLVVDAAERIWLGSYRRPGDREQEWWVFSVDGTVAGRVTVPIALTITDAGTDYVLGIWRDEDGVQTVRQYRLVPSS